MYHFLSQIFVYAEHKGWELVAEARREADAMVAEMADTIYFSSPESRASYVKPAAPAS